MKAPQVSFAGKNGGPDLQSDLRSFPAEPSCGALRSSLSDHYIATRKTMPTPPKHLLLVHGGHAGGRTHQLVQAVQLGVLATEEAVEVRALPALTAGADDLLWAHGLLIGTPEHFGYMSGAVKDFMDRTFYPVEGQVDGLPYAVFVSASNDGSGAVASIERIALGYKWRKISEPVIVRGEITDADRKRCSELGQTMAAGLSLDIF
jgi:multimeric flavodoxin WrbA